MGADLTLSCWRWAAGRIALVTLSPTGRWGVLRSGARQFGRAKVCDPRTSVSMTPTSLASRGV
jgi:hypothetical protein